MLTPEQIKNRKGGIGGSDAAALCGLSPYKTPRQLWFEKTGAEPVEVDNINVRIGQHLESFIIDEYRRLTGQAVSTPTNTFFHKDHEFLLAHVDGINDVTGNIVEAKYCGSFQNGKRFGEAGSDQIPDEYLMQCVHYAAVLDRPVVEVAALILGELKIFKYERNLDLEQKYIKKACEFWEMVQAKTMPDASNYEEAINEFKDQEKTVCSEEALNLAEQLELEKEKLKESKAVHDTLKERLILSMGDAATLINKQGKRVARIIEKHVPRLDMDLLREGVSNLGQFYKDTSHKELLLSKKRG